MPKVKQCPRCGKAFECHADLLSQCHCREVRLSAAQVNYLQQHYGDCLCTACLKELAAKVAPGLNR